MSKRNHIADMLKGLGMIFVVGGHTTSPLSGYYYTFHMGLFFAISGYLMAEHWRDMKLCQYVYKKFVKIIVPYIIFFIIIFIVDEWKSYQYMGCFYSIGIHQIKALLLGGGYLGGYWTPLWYFQHLFIAEIVMWFVFKASDKGKLILFMLLCFITIPFQTIVTGSTAFTINALPASLAYLLFGYGIEKRMINRLPHVSWGVLLIFTGWHLSLTYGGNIAGINSMFYYVESFCTILGLWIIVSYIKEKVILEYIGQRSLYILGIHSLITGVAGEFADYVKKMSGFKNEFIWHLIIVIVTVALCCCIADVFILLRRTVYANFSSKIQNICRKKSVK